MKQGRVGKKSKGYTVKRDSPSEKTTNNRHSNDRIRPMPAQAFRRKTISDLHNITVNSIGQPFMEANALNRSWQQGKIFDNKTYTDNQRLQSRHSPVTTNSIKKSTTLVDSNRDDLSQKSVTLPCAPKRISMASSGVHVIRVSKNRMAVSPKPLRNIPLEAIGAATQNQGSSKDIGNHFHSADSICNQPSSVHTPRIIVANVQNPSTKPLSHAPLKRKHGRQRSSSLNQVSVIKATSTGDNNQSVISHTSVSVYPDKNNQVGMIDGVVAILPRKNQH